MRRDPAAGDVGAGTYPVIVVVEDDPLERDVVSYVLGDAGYATVPLATGEEALAHIGRSPVTAVVADVRLAGMSGMELIRQLRAAPSTATLPVLLVTADPDVPLTVGLASGATDFIAKPVDAPVLVARLEAHLRSNAAWQAVLDAELHRRSAAAQSLVALARSEDAVSAADAVCRGLASLEHLVGAAILSVSGSSLPVPMSAHGRRGWRSTIEAVVRSWPARYPDRTVRPWVGQMPGGEVAVAVAPLTARQRSTGALVIGTPVAAEPTPSVDRLLAEAIDFAAVISGLVAPTLAAGERRQRNRARLRQLIQTAAFTPAFQPVVDLRDGRTVGYEALTRFHDGTPPSDRFAEAAALGLQIELEHATLSAAFRAASRLPPDCFLSLNASPDLLCDSPELIQAELGGVDRPVVIELTEHDPVDDYPALRASIGRLDPPVRLSVDDAGEGFASLRHILMLSPDYVKLDRSWVEGVHQDPTRQALVAGLVRFADLTSAELVAEGIEVEPDRAALEELSVPLGQGYLLGRPTTAS